MGPMTHDERRTANHLVLFVHQTWSKCNTHFLGKTIAYLLAKFLDYCHYFGIMLGWIPSTHSMTQIGDCKSHSVDKVFCNDWLLGSERPCLSPAVLYGWQLMPDTIVAWLAPIACSSLTICVPAMSPMRNWVSSPWSVWNMVCQHGFWSTPAKTWHPSFEATLLKGPPSRSTTQQPTASLHQDMVQWAKHGKNQSNGKWSHLRQIWHEHPEKNKCRPSLKVHPRPQL